ncbi:MULTISPECIES: hypothetical protein [unclassified Microcoleus]|nr:MULTISPECIES: hypothetical protein [unclassified Microcoleus]
MNSLIFISPSKGWGFQPILSGEFQCISPGRIKGKETGFFT